MVVKVLTLLPATSDTTATPFREECGCLVTALWGWKYRLPAWSPRILWWGWGDICYLVGIKVSAPYLAFSDTTWAHGWVCSYSLVRAEVQAPHLAFAGTGMGGVEITIGGSVGGEWLLFKSCLSSDVAALLDFWKERAGFGVFFSWRFFRLCSLIFSGYWCLQIQFGDK